MQKARRTFLKQTLLASACFSLPFLGKTAMAEDFSVPNITLNNGVQMPLAGLGTYGLKGKNGQSVMETAMAMGYRLFDSAQMYQNEDAVGAAVKASGIKREELFITTKLSEDMNFEETLKSFDASMKRLNLEVLDLLLIHSAYPQSGEMYRAMEKLYAEKRVRALGVSNFKAEKFSSFVKDCTILPAVNQCQTHIFQQQKALRAALEPFQTYLESWSPFVGGRRDFFENAVLRAIAQKHQKTPAQIALKFLVEQNIIVIPKTEKKERLKENLAIFNFSLDEDDRARLSALDTAKSAFAWD